MICGMPSSGFLAFLRRIQVFSKNYSLCSDVQGCLWLLLRLCEENRFNPYVQRQRQYSQAQIHQLRLFLSEIGGAHGAWSRQQQTKQQQQRRQQQRPTRQEQNARGGLFTPNLADLVDCYQTLNYGGIRHVVRSALKTG